METARARDIWRAMEHKEREGPQMDRQRSIEKHKRGDRMGGAIACLLEQGLLHGYMMRRRRRFGRMHAGGTGSSLGEVTVSGPGPRSDGTSNRGQYRCGLRRRHGHRRPP